MDESLTQQPWPAPRDGRVVIATLKRSRERIIAHWDISQKRWKKLLTNGYWRAIDSFHGSDLPESWEPLGSRGVE